MREIRKYGRQSSFEKELNSIAKFEEILCYCYCDLACNQDCGYPGGTDPGVAAWSYANLGTEAYYYVPP